MAKAKAKAKKAAAAAKKPGKKKKAAAPKAKAKAAPKAKPKAKAGPRAKPKAKAKAKAKGLVAKAKAATQALVAKAKAATEAIVAKVRRDAPAADNRHTTPGMEPFLLSETSPGKYSLLLSTFDAAAPAFEAGGIDAGGYAWEGVAKHVIANDAAALGDRINFDPEASMFCAYGDDRAGLEDLGKRLSSLYHDIPRLTDVVKEIGPGGFDD